MTTTQKRAALYLRVSTDKQQTDSQRQECADYALRENLPLIRTFSDTASGALPWRKRALGELIANLTTVSRAGGQLKLLNLTDKITDLLVITKLLTVFDVYEGEAEALNSFQ